MKIGQNRASQLIKDKFWVENFILCGRIWMWLLIQP